MLTTNLSGMAACRNFRNVLLTTLFVTLSGIRQELFVIEEPELTREDAPNASREHTANLSGEGEIALSGDRHNVSVAGVNDQDRDIATHSDNATKPSDESIMELIMNPTTESKLLKVLTGSQKRLEDGTVLTVRGAFITTGRKAAILKSACLSITVLVALLLCMYIKISISEVVYGPCRLLLRPASKETQDQTEGAEQAEQETASEVQHIDSSSSATDTMHRQTSDESADYRESPVSMLSRGSTFVHDDSDGPIDPKEEETEEVPGRFGVLADQIILSPGIKYPVVVCLLMCVAFAEYDVIQVTSGNSISSADGEQAISSEDVLRYFFRGLACLLTCVPVVVLDTAFEVEGRLLPSGTRLPIRQLKRLRLWLYSAELMYCSTIFVYIFIMPMGDQELRIMPYRSLQSVMYALSLFHSMRFTCALHIASAAATEKVLAVRRSLRQRYVGDEWFARVHRPAATLVTKIMPELSRLAPCLVALSAGWVLFSALTAFSALAKIVRRGDTHAGIILVLLFQAGAEFVLAALPLYTTASVSTACLNLLEDLNRLRCRADDDIKTHWRVQALETLLTRVNRGQGLGFVVFGVAVNRQFLKEMFLKATVSMTGVISFAVYLTRDNEQEQIKMVATMLGNVQRLELTNEMLANQSRMLKQLLNASGQ